MIIQRSSVTNQKRITNDGPIECGTSEITQTPFLHPTRCPKNQYPLNPLNLDRLFLIQRPVKSLQINRRNVPFEVQNSFQTATDNRLSTTSVDSLELTAIINAVKKPLPHKYSLHTKDNINIFTPFLSHIQRAKSSAPR